MKETQRVFDTICEQLDGMREEKVWKGQNDYQLAKYNALARESFLLVMCCMKIGIVLVLRSVLGQGEDYKQMMLILQNIRIPRACASFVVGACLSISGIVYQTTFNNTLVSPDILGVSSGCCVGAGIAILLGMSAGMIRILAFVFGFGAVVITILLGLVNDNDTTDN